MKAVSVFILGALSRIIVRLRHRDGLGISTHVQITERQFAANPDAYLGCPVFVEILPVVILVTFAWIFVRVPMFWKPVYAWLQQEFQCCRRTLANIRHRRTDTLEKHSLGCLGDDNIFGVAGVTTCIAAAQLSVNWDTPSLHIFVDA